MPEEMKLLHQINREKEEFEFEKIKIVPGYSFNQKDTIDMAYRYYNSQYMNGNVDEDDNYIYFFNIVKSPCRATTKAIDIDTKHIKIQTAAGGSPLRTWYFERDLKFWMKDKRFGKVLNRIFDELPKWGSVVIKVIAGVPHFVDLRNFIVRQDADTLDDANYIIEQHLYSPDKFRKIGTKLGWNNIEKAIKEHIKTKKPYIKVYERYGDVDGKYTRLFYADVGVDGVDEVTGDPIPYDGVELKRTPIDKHPYWEFHLEKIPGRWLGIGVIETLFDTQIKLNEDVNLEAKAAYLLSLQLFQTGDASINSNLMTEVVNGQVLNPDEPITQVPIDFRNLGFFRDSNEKWLTNRDEITFVREVIRGERAPAGTPLGSTRLAAAMAGGYFDQIMENIAEDIKEFLYKVIIPQFQKENSQEHTLRLIGEDLDTYNNMLIDIEVNKELEKLALTNKMPTEAHKDILRVSITENIQQEQEKLIKLPTNFYKNLKYKIDIIITGEQKDVQGQAQFIFSVLQAITVDPTILQDPTKRKMLLKLMELNGLQGFDFIPTETPSIQKLTEGQQVGGGVSRPVTFQTPPMRQTEKTV